MFSFFANYWKAIGAGVGSAGVGTAVVNVLGSIGHPPNPTWTTIILGVGAVLTTALFPKNSNTPAA